MAVVCRFYTEQVFFAKAEKAYKKAKEDMHTVSRSDVYTNEPLKLRTIPFSCNADEWRDLDRHGIFLCLEAVIFWALSVEGFVNVAYGYQGQCIHDNAMKRKKQTNPNPSFLGKVFNRRKKSVIEPIRHITTVYQPLKK